MSASPRTIALLIDADNVTSHYAEIVQFCARYGSLQIKRAYGDWEQPPLLQRASDLDELFIERVQQNRITPNATDFRMSLEIGVLLANREAEIYFIASGDCHFSVACQSIIRSGAKVYVIHNGTLCDELQTFSNKSFSIDKILEKRSPARDVTLSALIEAFEKTQPESSGGVTLSQLGQSWSRIKEKYGSQFAEKSLSTWLKDYPDRFEVVDQEVRLR